MTLHYINDGLTTKENPRVHGDLLQCSQLGLLFVPVHEQYVLCFSLINWPSNTGLTGSCDRYKKQHSISTPTLFIIDYCLPMHFSDFIPFHRKLSSVWAGTFIWVDHQYISTIYRTWHKVNDLKKNCSVVVWVQMGSKGPCIQILSPY